MTPEFCEAAVALNAAFGMADGVTIHNGSALDLPLPDAAFDRAYSQNVVMNIADKPRFYREAFRVLRRGGVLAHARDEARAQATMRKLEAKAPGLGHRMRNWPISCSPANSPHAWLGLGSRPIASIPALSRPGSAIRAAASWAF